MNVYEEAHKLTQAVRESEEYKQYQAAKEKLKANPELEKNLNDFKSQQLSMQAGQMMGQQMDPNMMGHIQDLYGILLKDPLAAEYLQCEMRFSLMMNDVFKILGEVVDLGLDKLGGALNGR